MMAALPLSWIQTLAGLALLGTISGSLFQALNHEAERDAAIVTFLMTASGVTILGIGSAFWGLVLGGYAMPCFHALAARSWDGVMPITLRNGC
jgi:benzoate membrane transport protein